VRRERASFVQVRTTRRRRDDERGTELILGVPPGAALRNESGTVESVECGVLWSEVDHCGLWSGLELGWGLGLAAWLAADYGACAEQSCGKRMASFTHFNNAHLLNDCVQLLLT
jgi:hypothetical protein